jgi:hypothetical protein
LKFLKSVLLKFELTDMLLMYEQFYQNADAASSNYKNIQLIVSVNTKIWLRRFRLISLRTMHSTPRYKERLNLENTCIHLHIIHYTSKNEKHLKDDEIGISSLSKFLYKLKITTNCDNIENYCCKVSGLNKFLVHHFHYCCWIHF